MKSAVIDTHALVWYLTRSARVGRGALAVLRAAERGKAQVLVPTMVLVEIALLREHGRRILDVAEVMAAVAQSRGLIFVPLGLSEGREFALLSAMSDPFDRMMVATACAAQCPLITADEAIAETNLVSILWD